MIGQLRGILAAKKPPYLLIDVAGVGYEVQASMTTIFQLPPVGEVSTLYTHLIVREDAFLLYGFFDEQERMVFCELIKVSGVGPKLALAILSGMDVAALVQCVEKRDSASLNRVPGVGPKTAERLVVEMQDKLRKKLNSIQHTFSKKTLLAPGEQINNANIAEQDAVSALIALGYKPQEASKAISNVIVVGADSEMLIRLALRNMA